VAADQSFEGRLVLDVEVVVGVTLLALAGSRDAAAADGLGGFLGFDRPSPRGELDLLNNDSSRPIGTNRTLPPLANPASKKGR
jgi:hypothetical protein